MIYRINISGSNLQTTIWPSMCLNTNHTSSLRITKYKEQHPFSSIFPRLSVPRRETTGLVLSISSCTGGTRGDKFNSYQSPLARHQAHVVPEQMLLKVYIAQILVLCSVSDTCFNHYSVALSSVIALSELQAGWLPHHTARLHPQNWNLSKFMTYWAAKRCHWFYSPFWERVSSFGHQIMWHMTSCHISLHLVLKVLQLHVIQWTLWVMLEWDQLFPVFMLS